MVSLNTPDSFNRQANSLAQWELAAARSCVPLVVSGKADLSLSGALVSATISDVCVSRITAEGHIAEHNRIAIAN